MQVLLHFDCVISVGDAERDICLQERRKEVMCFAIYDPSTDKLCCVLASLVFVVVAVVTTNRTYESAGHTAGDPLTQSSVRQAVMVRSE